MFLLQNIIMGDADASSSESDWSGSETTSVKRRRARWTDDDLKSAVRLVLKNELSLREAGRAFRIPRSTLHRYVNSFTNEKKKLGRKTYLTEQQEEDLVQYSHSSGKTSRSSSEETVYSTTLFVRSPFGFYRR